MGEVRCIECVKAVPAFSCNDLKPGDHVIFCGALYDHHGIILSKKRDNFEIAEATFTVLSFLYGILRGFSFKPFIQITTKKKFDFVKKKICVVKYKYRYTKSETIHRARTLHSAIEKTGKYVYNLLMNNCEHFATFCATGEPFSVQVSKFILMSSLIWKRKFSGFNDELVRVNAEFEAELICKDCYKMTKNLLDVSLRPINSETDILEGDIIRYKYWGFVHEAVVLKKEKHTKNKKIAVCSVAHYAFSGPFSHRSIKEEKINVRLDKSIVKLDYDSTPKRYNVYTPKEVVQRAQSRIGEQLFVFYSNDSSNFVRWCKLKLLK